jgi:hypothetical protein
MARIGIADAKRLVILARRILGADKELPFGGPAVAPVIFIAFRAGAESDVIVANERTVLDQPKSAVLFEDVDLGVGYACEGKIKVHRTIREFALRRWRWRGRGRFGLFQGSWSYIRLEERTRAQGDANKPRTKEMKSGTPKNSPAHYHF